MSWVVVGFVGVLVCLLFLAVFKLRELRGVGSFLVGDLFYLVVGVTGVIFVFFWWVDPVHWFGWWFGVLVCVVLVLIVYAEWLRLQKGVVDDDG